MKRTDADCILNIVARQNGVTRTQVETEISAAIQEAMAQPDPLVQLRWKALWPDGRTPSPAEFLETLAALAQNGKTAFPH